MHKKNVIITLIVMVVLAIVGAIVGNADPFGVNNLWLTTFVLWAGGSMGSFIALWVAIRNDRMTEKIYISSVMTAFFVTLMLGATVIATVESSLTERATALLFAGLGAAAMTLLVSSLVNYLVMDFSVTETGTSTVRKIS